MSSVATLHWSNELASVDLHENFVRYSAFRGTAPWELFGMMRPAIDLQEQGDAYYFIANYHSMTSLFDAEKRRQNVVDVALDFMACGLDPERCVFFKQSDIPEHTELTWMLTTLTPMGLLERCHSYKDKIAKGLSPNHGLFAYPVLMAADILIYDSQVVPVGKDQGTWR